MSAAHDTKPPAPEVGGVTEFTSDCEVPGCGQRVIWRRREDGAQGTWAPEPHNAKCGLPCSKRPTPGFSGRFIDEHTAASCPKCAEDHPKAKSKRRRARRT